MAPTCNKRHVYFTFSGHLLLFEFTRYRLRRFHVLGHLPDGFFEGTNSVSTFVQVMAWCRQATSYYLCFFCSFLSNAINIHAIYNQLDWCLMKNVFQAFMIRSFICISGASSLLSFFLIWFKLDDGICHHHTVYPKKYAHGFVVLCFVVVMESFIMNSHEVFNHIHQGCFAGTGAIVRLPQCQWSKPDGYGKISQCITTTKHSKAKTVCIFLGIYCNSREFDVGSSPLSNMHMLLICLSACVCM